MGKLTAADVIKSIQTFHCMPELARVKVIA
jgi:hypothetical protein